jgi:hypothetical protein
VRNQDVCIGWNRWREEQSQGKQITYGDLVRHYIALNKLVKFEKIPQDRYVNFLAEFLAKEKVRHVRTRLRLGPDLKLWMLRRTTGHTENAGMKAKE